jgi:hypothetical protein
VRGAARLAKRGRGQHTYVRYRFARSEVVVGLVAHDSRAGHYERGLQTKAGEVRLRVCRASRSSSRATRIPEIDVSTMSAGHSRVQCKRHLTAALFFG